MLLNYHIGRLVLSSLCVGDLVWLVLSSARVAGWSTSACDTGTTQTQPHQISNTQPTKNKTTDVVIQQHSRKLLMMDILMSETRWAHKKWNKIASDIKLVFYSSGHFIFTFSSIYFTLWAVLNAHSLKLFATNFIIFILSRFQTNLLAANKSITWKKSKFDIVQKSPNFLLEIT